MATYRWIGGAAAVAQVSNYTIAGVWEADDIVRCTIGQKSFDTTAGSTTAATIAQNVVDAWNALSSTQYPEFAEITASRSGDDILLTADTAGKPFVATLTPLESDGSASGAQTIEGGTIATTGTTTTTNKGPNDWASAANWSAATVPTTGDTVYVEDTDDEILYGLAQSGVTLAALHIPASFTGKLGLPKWNSGGYAEYRDDYLAISATILKIGAGEGPGSPRIKINVGTAQTTIDVDRSAPTLEPGVQSILLKGTHASNVASINRGDVGFAIFGGETTTIATLRVGFIDNVDRDTTVLCGSGVTLTTISQLGGKLEVNSNSTTANIRGGVFTVKGSATVTTLDVGVLTPENPHRPVCYYNSSGTVTTANARRNGTIDFSQDMRAKTVTTLNRYPGSIVKNPLQAAVFTTSTLAGGATPGEVGGFFG